MKRHSSLTFLKRKCNVAGSSSSLGASYVQANLFQTVAGGSVSQIDLGVTNFSGSNEFEVSIWTDSGGMPGTMVGGYWGVTTAASTCCILTTIPGISGVTLAPGTDYFMELGPVSPNDNSFNIGAWNTVGLTGVDL